MLSNIANNIINTINYVLFSYIKFKIIDME